MIAPPWMIGRSTRGTCLKLKSASRKSRAEKIDSINLRSL